MTHINYEQYMYNIYAILSSSVEHGREECV